jgi:hypothetical protein
VRDRLIDLFSNKICIDKLDLRRRRQKRENIEKFVYMENGKIGPEISLFHKRKIKDEKLILHRVFPIRE